MPEPKTCGFAEPLTLGGRVCKHGLVVASGGECVMNDQAAEVAEERREEWEA